MKERLPANEIPSSRYDNLTKEEWDALNNLKDNPNVTMKSTGKGSIVIVWKRKDYLKQTYKQLDDKKVCKQVPNNASFLINAIMKALKKLS